MELYKAKGAPGLTAEKLKVGSRSIGSEKPCALLFMSADLHLLVAVFVGTVAWLSASRSLGSCAFPCLWQPWHGLQCLAKSDWCAGAWTIDLPCQRSGMAIGQGSARSAIRSSNWQPSVENRPPLPCSFASSCLIPDGASFALRLPTSGGPTSSKRSLSACRTPTSWQPSWHR